jgi:hypothetical protein
MKHFAISLSCMNLNRAVELLRVVSAIPVNDSAKHPEIRIFYAVGEGCTLQVKADAVNAEYRNHLRRIVESCKLGLRESEGYLIISGH